MSSVRWYFGVVRRLDGVVVLDQARLPLRGFAREEAVEVFEAVAVRPAVLRADRGRFRGGRVVPLAEGGRVIAVVLQHLGNGGGRLRNDAGVAVECDGALGDGARADAGVIAARQQRGARRRADRGGVECVVSQCPRRRASSASACGLRRQRYRRRRSRHRRSARSGCWAHPPAAGSGLGRPLHRRVLQARLGLAGHRCGGERQYRAVAGDCVGLGFVGCAMASATGNER